MEQDKYSLKSRLVSALLCFFLGWTGAHRYYVGKVGTGILMLCSGGGLGIWWLADFIFVICGSFRDKEDKRVVHWFEQA